MKIDIRKVDENNKADILKLKVASDQLGFIETVEECLKDAKECHYYVPAGLYIDDVLIGFAMYGSFPHSKEGKRVWLDRFLIDENYQGRGYGTIMLEYLIDYLKYHYQAKRLYLSLYDDNEHAYQMCLKQGFKTNGEFDENQEKIMVLEF